MMKQTTILILILLFGLFPAFANDSFYTLEVKNEAEAACPCNCNKDNDLQILRDIYNNNGGANWVLPSSAVYEDLLDANFPVKNVPNAGVSWDINSPNARDEMGNWHGVITNQFGCVTDLILWTGPYNVNSNTLIFAPQGIGLIGSLPQSIGGLCALRRFMAPHNDLSGSIPPSIEDLCSLQVLLLQNNQLSGVIPPEIGNLNNLLHLGLHYNDISGTLPNTISNLANLVILHLKSNKLSGAIPADIGNLQRALLTDLSDNCFSGIVPPSIVNIGRNSINGGFFLGQTIALWLQNNKLDSLPDISAMQVLNTGLVDVSGNHFTFDDILPNINILTKYDNQTLDLDQFYCAQVGDSIIIRPGFDAMIDAGFYTNPNNYIWTRPGTSYQAMSDLNFIFFTNVSTLSAGNFSISVTNPLAPDLQLEVTNLEIEVVDEANIFGTTEVCANATQEYNIFNFGVGYDFTVTGGTIISSDSSNVTVQWGNNALGQLCATNRGTCSQTTCIPINISPTIDLSISTPDTLNCSKRVDTLQGTANFSNLSFAWLTTQGGVISDGPNSIEINTPGDYILEATDDIGCTARDTVLVVEQLDNFQVAITGTTFICENGETTLEVNPNYQSYIWSNGATFNAIQTNSPGQYQVTVTNSNNCTATSFVTVQTIVPPEAVIVKSGDLDCSNDEVQLFSNLTSTVSSSEWRDSNGNLLGSNPIITIVDAGIYILIVTDQSGCSSTDQIEIIKDESVIIPAISGTTSLCEGGAGQLSVDQNYTSYVWSTGATTASIAISDSSLNYSVTVTDVSGCSGSNNINIQRRPKPIVAIGGQLDFCEGNSTELFVDSTFTSFNWSTGDNTFKNIVNAAGVYSVTVTDTQNCSNVASVEVTERPPFLADIIGETTFCKGTDISLLAAQINNVTYEWSTGETSPFILVDDSGTYSLTITDGRNCSSSTSTTINELALPSITFSGETTLCENGSSTIQVDEFYPDYSWSTNASNQSIVVNNTETYIVTVTDNAGCSNSESIEIVKSPYLTPEIIGNQVLCNNEEITLSSNNTYASYQWSNGIINQDISVNIPGTYTLIVTNNEGCTGETFIEVAEATSPIPQIIGNPSLCTGTATSLTTQKDYQSYVWSTGETTETIAANSAGTFVVTVTNTAGCTGTTFFTINEAPNIEFNIVGNTAICAGSSTTLQSDRQYLTYKWSTGADSSNIVVDQIGTYSLTVTDQSGCTGITSIDVTENSSIFPQIIGTTTLCGNEPSEISTDADYASYTWSNGATSKSIIVDSPAAYQVTVSNAAGCTGEATITIEETPALQPNILGNRSFCEGQSTTLSLGLPYSSYLWTDGIIRSTIEVSEAGVYAVTVIDKNGCTGSASVEVTEGALAPPLITPEAPALCQGDLISIQAEEGFTNYTWSNGTIGSSLLTSEAQLYSVTVTDENGCTGVNSVAVRPLPVPNINTGEPKKLCAGDSIDVRISLFGFSNYEWITGDTTAEIFVNSGGAYTVTVTNDDGCTGAATYEVTEFEQPQLTIINPSGKNVLGCDRNNKLVLFDIGSGADAYRWEDASGNVLGTESAFEILKGGTYKVIGIDTTTKCETIIEKTIVELENTVEVIAADASLALDCQIRTKTIDVSSSIDADTYEWEFLIPGGFVKRLTDVSTNTYRVDSSGVGTYRIIGINSASGCRDSVMVDLMDNSKSITPIIAGPSELCENETGELMVTGEYENYSWTGGGATQQIEITEAKLYEVRVTDSMGCTGVESKMVSSKNLTELDITLQIDNSDVCEGSEAEIDFMVQNNSSIGPFNLTLSNGTEEIIFDNILANQELPVSPTTTSRYSIMDVEDLGNSCSFFNGITEELSFNIIPIPIARSTQKKACSGQDAQNATFNLDQFVNEVKDDPNSSVRWYRDSTGNSPINATQSFATSDAVTIYAKTVVGICSSKPVPVILDVGDCSTSLEFDMEIGADLDLSDLPGDDRSVYITNRWGDLVYASEDYEKDNRFTGIINGSQLPQGAYYIYIKNEERRGEIPVPYKGVIYLLK